MRWETTCTWSFTLGTRTVQAGFAAGCRTVGVDVGNDIGVDVGTEMSGPPLIIAFTIERHPRSAVSFSKSSDELAKEEPINTGPVYYRSADRSSVSSFKLV